MAYTRRTRDVWTVQSNWGHGWEDVTSEETYSEARERLREYRENEAGIPHRIRLQREPIGQP
jgi:hypothetical protein